MAAVLVLIPKMVQVLTEGILSISEAGKEFSQKYFKGRKIYIGIDATAMLGHPATLSAILIMTPIVALMSLLPGQQTAGSCQPGSYPLVPDPADFIRQRATYCTSFCPAWWCSPCISECATALSGAHTQLAVLTGFNMPEGATIIGSLSEGGNFITWAMVSLSKLLGLYTAPF